MLDARQHPCPAPGLRSVTLVGGKITQALQKDIAAGGQGQGGQVAVTLHGGELPLGTGGLVRAYTQSTQAGIDAAQLVVVSRCVDLRIRIAYPRYEQLMRLAEDHGAKVLSTDFADAVTMNLRMLDGTQQPLLDALTALERGQEDVEVSDPIDAAF